MIHSTQGEKSADTRHPPRPVIKKKQWPFLLVWIVPICAAALAGYYYFARFQQKGILITLKFADAAGVVVGQTQMMHLGVSVGQVEEMELSPDQSQVSVHVRLKRADDAFAKKGASFWIVQPEISAQEISGLGTMLSGPFINATPGTGDRQTEFVALQGAPVAPEDGIRIILRASNLKQMQAGAPVYYRGIKVGVIEGIQLSNDAAYEEVHAFVRRHFAPLVRVNSQFWVESAVDLKGSIFTGVQMKMESIQSLLSGGVGFANPEQKMGVPAQEGTEFVLHDDADKEWLTWAPTIDIGPDDSSPGRTGIPLPEAPGAIRSSVGP